MRHLLPCLTLFFFFAALGCDSEGENVHNTTTTDTTSPDSTTPDDAVEPEDLPQRDPGPPFNDTLAWKVMDTGEKVIWNTLTGRKNDDGSYEVYVGGAFGTVMWYESAKNRWNHINLAETVEVNGLWADGPDYIVICGEQGLLKRYYDFARSGSADWYNDDLSTGLDTELEAVDGYDRDNLWAVGEMGSILQFTDGAWKQWSAAEAGLPEEPAPNLNAVLALGPQKALIVGDGLLLEYDAGAFTLNDTDFADYKLRVILETPDGVWIGADKGTLFKSDGQGGWEKHLANSYSQFKALWSSSDGVLYAGGTQPTPALWLYDGNEGDNWDYLAVESPKFIKDSYPDHVIDAQSRVTGIWGTGSENIFACTKEQQVVQYAVHP